MSNNFFQFMKQCQDRVENILRDYLAQYTIPSLQLKNAVSYATLTGGKRLRPLLVYATGLMVGGTWEQLDYPACAVELIHTYSLIHDDLPAMDNADMRRNQPSCHKQFNEATAILAGDGLQPLAFELLVSGTSYGLSAEQCLKMINVLAHASGLQGMVGGQALDLENTTKTLSPTQIETIHLLKTGALFKASVLLGALTHTPHNSQLLELLGNFAVNLGLAFQIQDDILDSKLKSDLNTKFILDETSYVRTVGAEEAQHKVRELYSKAVESLAPFGTKSAILLDLIEFLCNSVTQ